MKRRVSIFIVMVFSLASHALELEQGKWYDFEGMLGKTTISLSLYRYENGLIKGNYCYAKYEKKIQLSGTINGNEIELTEFINGKINGYFKGSLVSDKSDRLEGSWSDSSKTTVLDFKLGLGAVISGSTYEKRYALHGNDSDIEDFMKQVKTAVLKEDKIWLAEHIRFPIKAYVNNTLITVKNKQAFTKNFTNIFYTEYKAKVKASCSCNLFSNYQGVMLGQGLIWIYDAPGSTIHTFKYQIIAINNG